MIYTIVPKRAKWCVLLGASAVYYVMAAGLRTLWLVAAILIVYGGGLLLGHLNDQGKARRKAAADKEEKKQIRKNMTPRSARWLPWRYWASLGC